MPQTILTWFVILLSLMTINAQSSLSTFPIDTLLLSTKGIQERMELYQQIQETMTPILQRNLVIEHFHFRRDSRLIYQYKMVGQKNIFEVDIAILTPMQNMQIAGANIYTKIWRKVKNHYLILSIQSKGRRQKKLGKEIVKKVSMQIDQFK